MKFPRFPVLFSVCLAAVAAFLPYPAFAPPIFGVFLVSFVGLAISASAITGAVLLGAAAITAITYVVGLVNQPDAFRLNLGLDDRTSLVRLPTAARRVIYGTASVGPQIIYLETEEPGSSIKYLHVVCAICDHALASIDDLVLSGGRYLTAAECASLTAGTTVDVTAGSSDPGLGALRNESVSKASDGGFQALKVIAGLSATGDLAAKLDAENVPAPNGDLWVTSGFKCTGMSWIYFRFGSTADRTEEKAFNGLPEISVRVRRSEDSLEQYSDSSLYAAPTLVDSVTDLTGLVDASFFGSPGVQWGPGYRALARAGDSPLPSNLPTFEIDGNTFRLYEVYVRGTDVGLRFLDNVGTTFQEAYIGGGSPLFPLSLPSDLRWMIYNRTRGCIVSELSVYTLNSGISNGFGSFRTLNAADTSCYPQVGDTLEVYFYRSDQPVVDIAELTGTFTATADNAAACAYDYLKRYTNYGDTLFGDPMIDTASVEVAALVCHQRGWTANGAITLDDSPDAVLTQFEQAMVGGFIVDRGGVAEIRAGGPRPSSFTITEDQVLPDWAITPSLPRVDRSSIITVEHAGIGSDSGLNETQTVTIRNVSAVEKYGEKSSEVSVLLIDNRQQASQLAKVALLRQWEAFQMSIRTNAAPLGIGPGDTCLVNLPRLEIVNKKFRVISVEVQGDLSLQLELFEEDDLAWDALPANATEFTPAANPNIVEA